MLNVTNSAMEMCHTTIVQLSNSQARSKCLRFVQDSDKSLTLSFDNPRKNDEIIEHEGVAVFAVPRQFVDFCSDKTLDIDESGQLTLS